MRHKKLCDQQEKTRYRTSNEVETYWKKYSHRNPILFRKYADFEADIEIDFSNKGNKITILLNQIPVCNGYYKVSELDDALQSGYFELFPGYDNVDWFVSEVTI